MLPLQDVLEGKSAILLANSMYSTCFVAEPSNGSSHWTKHPVANVLAVPRFQNVKSSLPFSPSCNDVRDAWIS